MTAQKHFSMIREFHLADFFTLANGACGYRRRLLRDEVPRDPDGTLFSHRRGARPRGLRFRRHRRPDRALAANAFRARPRVDSLADIISFGVAPAALGFAAGLRGGWDWVALTYSVCCGVGRLARFNVTAEKLSEGSGTGKVKYFEGTPIPTSVVLTGVLAFAAWQGRLGDYVYWGAWQIGPWELHPLVLLFVLSGTLMISKTLRIPKL